MIDSSAVRELVDRYHAAVNRHDWRLLGDLFTEGARWIASDPVNLKFSGRAAIMAGLKASVLRQTLLVQTCAGVVVEAISGAEARVQSTLIEFGREPNKTRWMAVGFYDDRVVRQGDRWLFSERLLTVRYLGDVDLAGQVFDLKPEC